MSQFDGLKKQAQADILGAFESIDQQVAELEAENEQLKALINEKAKDSAQVIIERDELARRRPAQRHRPLCYAGF